MYVENLTSSYPNYTIEGIYYWSGFSITLCIILGAIWAFNLYKLFTGYNTFKTLGIDMFWSTIHIGGSSLPRPITLFFNKLALLALIALLIAFCYLDLVCCDLDSRKDKRNSDSNLQICLSTAQLFFCLWSMDKWRTRLVKTQNRTHAYTGGTALYYLLRTATNSSKEHMLFSSLGIGSVDFTRACRRQAAPSTGLEVYSKDSAACYTILNFEFVGIWIYILFVCTPLSWR